MAKVHCLLNEDSQEWCSEMVHAFFEPVVASEILKIPLARHGGEDFVSWPLTKHGNYTVRSVYYFARYSKLFQAQGTVAKGNTSNAKVVEKDWKALWHIKALGKMIIHLWRFAHNCLLTGVELSKRQTCSRYWTLRLL
jgi:hypothetical protein